jgi:hypothetical protein
MHEDDFYLPDDRSVHTTHLPSTGVGLQIFLVC